MPCPQAPAWGHHSQLEGPLVQDTTRPHRRVLQKDLYNSMEKDTFNAGTEGVTLNHQKCTPWHNQPQREPRTYHLSAPPNPPSQQQSPRTKLHGISITTEHSWPGNGNEPP